VLVVADEPSVKALLVEVPDADMALVEPLRVDAVEAVHPAREVLENRADDEVEMVVEQAVRVDRPAEAPRGGAEEGRPADAIGVVDDDPHLRHTAGRDVEDADGRERAARNPCHVPTVRRLTARRVARA
jgi:hypothetical protein